MTVLRVRAADFDLVSYEIATFRPGERIRTLGLENAKYALKPTNETVTVRGPARIALTVLDMNRFAPDRPGGGGVGFALELYSTVEIRCIPSGLEVDYSRVPLIENFVHAFKAVTGYQGGFSIKARDHQRLHVGLGSTSSVMTSLAHGLNEAVGAPLSGEQIHKLIGYNYVEESPDGKVMFGFQTGVGAAVGAYGGMAIVGDELSVIYQRHFARDKNVFVITPASAISSAGNEEASLLMNRARELDHSDRQAKAYMVLMDLIPALERDDLKRMGDVVWQIQLRGAKRAEVEHHHNLDNYLYMARLRKAGCEVVGMSSVGPTIGVITEKSRADVERIASDCGLKIELATRVDNEGLKITKSSS